MRHILSLSFLCIVLLGCANVSSDEVKTSGIYATFTVRGDSYGGATGEAIFQVGGPTGTFVSLESGDSITCDGQRMTRQEAFGAITYQADLRHHAGKVYAFVFQRPGEQPYEATVYLPETLKVTWPQNNERLLANHSLDVRWTRGVSSAYEMRTILTGPSGETDMGSSYPDLGYKFITGEKLALPLNSRAESFTIKVERWRKGSFPSGLKGGGASGVQSDLVTFIVEK